MALPGVTTILQDHFYTLSRTDIPVGPRVLAIAPRDTADGTSDGTDAVYDYDPYYAKSEQAVINAFGSGSGCHRAYVELVAGGAARVYLVALPKGITDANLNSQVAVTITGNGTYHTHGSHIPFDHAFDAAETAQPDIIVPWGRGGHPLEWQNPATPSDEPPFMFAADNSATYSVSMAKRVADQMATITNRSHPCFAVMGIKPFVDAASTGASTTGAMTASQIASHVALSTLTDHNASNFGTGGPYLTVVATELRPVGYDSSFGFSNGACVLAGYVSQLNSWSAPTGKTIFNVESMRYNPTRTQQDSMTTKGVVPVSLDFNRAPIWVDGVTFGASTSDYTRLSTLRIIFDAVLLVRQVAQGFVGEGATLQNRNALETAISAGMRGMQQAGALLASDFVVSYFPNQNKAIIDLVLTPAFELRNIVIQVAVNI